MADEHLTRRPESASPAAGSPAAGSPAAGSWGPTTEHSGAEPGWSPAGTDPQPTAAYRQPTGAHPSPPVAPGEPRPDADPFGELPTPPKTDELPFPRRFARRVRRGEPQAAVVDAARTIEAKLHPDFRVAIGTGVVAVAAAVVQSALFPVSSTTTTTKLIGYGLALAFLVFGLLAVRSSANESARLSSARGGRTAASAIKVAALLVGYILVGLVTLAMLDVRLGNLLVGGALTGVVIGIAAQQALGNVFAGLVLLFSRPYVPGESIRVNTGALGGPHDGVVISVGLTYTVLMTSYGPLNIPNSGLLGSAIGPQPPDEDEDDEVPDPPAPDKDPSAPTSQGGPPTGGAPA